MANENIFTTKAKDYASSRPGYAPEAYELIRQTMLKKNARIVDVGAGTGIFAGEFLHCGYEVFCIEPNEAMRREAEAKFQQLSLFHSVAAAAEQIPLPDGCADLITAASAFHWFDVQHFRTECLRLLRPGGLVCIVLNARQYDAFTERQHELCMKLCPSFHSLTHGLEKTQQRVKHFFGDSCSEARFTFPLDYSKEAFIRRSLSSSYAPERGTPNCTAYTAQLRCLLDACFESEQISIANETVLYWGTLSSDEKGRVLC